VSGKRGLLRKGRAMLEGRTDRVIWNFGTCAVIVAHPGDETLWAGGTILMHPESRWTVLALCRPSDEAVGSHFTEALEQLGVSGRMGELPNTPTCSTRPARDILQAITALIPPGRFDLVITHGIFGECSRHPRHEETARAVMTLRESGRVSCDELWMFAFEDGGGKYLPRPSRDADLLISLPKEIWQRKYDIITGTYGFAADSIEAQTTPRQEAFWKLGVRKR